MNRILAGIIFFFYIYRVYLFPRAWTATRVTETDSLHRFWSAAQLVSQYYRFESLLGLYTIDDTMNLDDVRMRLDIMLSQSDLIKEGDLGRYIESNIAHRELAVKLENTLSFLDVNLEKWTVQHSRLIWKMHTLDAPLGRLSSGALNKDVNSINNANQKFRRCTIFILQPLCCW